MVPMPICALCSSEFVEEVDAANPPPPTIGSTGRMLDQDPELELDLDLNIDEELARIFESTLGRAFSSIESTDNVSDTEYHDTVADVSDIPHTYDYDYHSDDEFASLRFEEEAARQRVRQRQQLQEVQRQQAPPTPPSSAPPRNALARAQSDLHETSEPLSRVVTGSVWDRLANIVRNQSRGRHVHISSATSVDMLATRNLRVGDEDIEQECAICQDIFGSELTLMRMPCDHEYHETCLRPWLEMNTTCPIW
ncbi:hypothetical protein BCR43DRAFT_298678 [Syncephalastrum racemosum]|uniref:RING-type domain-containing protein n=1 Tax=Syncephalastrum racemosum TaxID=13706 RepID=A0A1X2H9N2_SYNRA|nr:hypothetical protein BCR43DRAFT_298678 [Syncephalastrum racemosum]